MTDLPRQLLQLVKTQKFAAADRLRIFLLSNHTSIPHHRIYEKAARNAVLSQPLGANPRKVDQFSFWFSLVPAKHEISHPESFVNLKRAIFDTGMPSRNVPLAMQFALICASKGYAHVAMSESIYLVQRFANPMDGARFLYQFETEAMQSAKRTLPHDTKQRTTHLKSLQGVAIRACIEADWILEAVDLVVAFRKMGTQIPEDTIRFLVQKLRRVGKDSLVSTVLQTHEAEMNSVD